MNCADRRGRNSGFTLIELLIATTILGILTAVVFSGLRTGLQIWTRGNSAIEEIQSSQMNLSMLRTQIQGALPLIVTRGTNTALSFSGEEARLRFVTRTSFPDGPDSVPRWVELRWEPGANALFAREFRVLSPGNGPAAEPLWEGRILEGEQFSVQFLARRLPGQHATWSTSWAETTMQLPAAVRLRFQQGGQQEEIISRLDYAENSWSDQWFR